MKRNLWRLACGLLLVLFIADSIWAESFVWVARGSKNKVYLAGSCHVLRASDHPLPAEFWSAYKDSSKIIFEASQDEMAGPDFQQKLLLASIYDDGTTLQQHLSPQAYAKAEAFCKKRSYQMDQLQILRPWMFTMTMTMMEMKKLGAEPMYGVDYLFNEQARKDRKAVGSLETVDEQLGFLTFMDSGMDNEQIIQTIDELDQLSFKLNDILSAWRKGDEVKTEELLLQDLKDYPKLYQTLISDRNKKWVRRIETYLQNSDNVMFIVGAAHLVGNNGVVELLRKRGYKTSKLQSP